MVKAISDYAKLDYRDARGTTLMQPMPSEIDTDGTPREDR